MYPDMGETHGGPVENTDTHLFYEDPKDEGYSPSCHMTKDRKLGIQVGGHVIQKPLRDWHEQAYQLKNAEHDRDEWDALHTEEQSKRIELEKELKKLQGKLNKFI